MAASIMGVKPLVSIIGKNPRNYYDSYTSTILKRIRGLLKESGITLLNDNINDSLTEELEDIRKVHSDFLKIKKSFEPYDEN